MRKIIIISLLFILALLIIGLRNATAQTLKIEFYKHGKVIKTAYSDSGFTGNFIGKAFLCDERLKCDTRKYVVSENSTVEIYFFYKGEQVNQSAESTKGFIEKTGAPVWFRGERVKCDSVYYSVAAK